MPETQLTSTNPPNVKPHNVGSIKA